MSFSVKIRADGFEKRRLVTGPIWLQIDDQAFPEEDWSDFPVIVLGWWLSNITPLITNQALRCECLFMDGPLRFNITKLGRDRWEIAFIRNTLDGDVCWFKGEIDPKTLIDGILSAAEAVIDLCKQKEWESSDLVTLERETAAVKRLIKSLPE